MRKIFLCWLLAVSSAFATGPDNDSDTTDNKIEKIPPLFSENLSLQTLEGRIAAHWPSQFKGYQQVDPQLVAEIRSHFQRSGAENIAVYWADHCEALIPLVQQVADSLACTGTLNPRHPVLRAEIQQHIQKQEVSPLWTLLLHYRAILEDQSVSADEQDLFNHVIQPEIMRGLLKEGAWENSLKTLLSTEHHKKRLDPEDVHYSQAFII